MTPFGCVLPMGVLAPRSAFLEGNQCRQSLLFRETPQDVFYRRKPNIFFSEISKKIASNHIITQISIIVEAI